MPKFQLVYTRIVTDMKDGQVYTEVTRACTPPEVEVLRQIYGADRVQPQSHAGWIEREMMEEAEILQSRYCHSEANKGLIRALFPGRVPIMPTESAEIAVPAVDPNTRATLDSLKAEFKRLRKPLPAGKPTVARLTAVLHGYDEVSDEPAEVADAHADA